jgi:hypothetical protein
MKTGHEKNYPLAEIYRDFSEIYDEMTTIELK